MDQESLPTGDLDEEVLQEEPDYVPLQAVPVTVCGPVGVQNVPSRAGASFNRLLVATEDVRVLLSADPRRRIARLICGQSFAVGSDQSSVTQGVAAVWPANTVCEITHGEEVWVDVTVDAAISVMVENWAD